MTSKAAKWYIEKYAPQWKVEDVVAITGLPKQIAQAELILCDGDEELVIKRWKSVK